MSASTSRHDDADTVGRLALQARAHVEAGDVAAWLDVLRATGHVEHPHLRHHARRLLAEGALSAPAEDPVRLAQVLLALAEGLVEVLEADPAQPDLLNLAGAACFELGAADAARALFAGAARLDPELPHLAENLAACAARRPVALPPPLAAARARLEPRASAVADRARSATGQRISLCMIAKDEAEMLPRCLEAVHDVVDEIVLVDTGSSDATIEIARSFGARVLERPWDGDFSAARNVALEEATGDWILQLDADEVLVAADAGRLRDLAGRTWREAFYLVEINHVGELGDGAASSHSALRLWRHRPTTRFEGRIHEQVAQHFPAYLPDRLEHTDVRIEHFGYLGAVRAARGKAARNLELLERQHAEGHRSPFLDFNLGSEHLAVGDVEKAKTHFRAAWVALSTDPERERYGFVPSLASRYVRSLRETRDAGVAAVSAEVLALFPGFTDVVFEQALDALAGGRGDRAVELLERCLEMGDAPARYSPTIGMGSSIARVQLAEVLAARGRAEEAERLLERNLELHPGFLGTVNPLATLRLRRGVPAADVVAAIHRGVTASTPSVRFVLAVALHERGAAAEAQAELEAVLAAQPDNAYARVALAEALLSQGELAAAADAAAAVPGDAPAAAAAARSELFARLAQGAVDGVAERARERLDTHEAAVFTAWADGGGVPLEGAALCATMLDALIRLEAFDAFEALAVALERGTVPWRRRRELLATTYLRRGLLGMAADEWIAVCREAPRDAAALRGLGEVAERQGLDEDAAAFRAEAEHVGV